MSEAATKQQLEQLKQQAEAQMRRAAPPLSGKDPKRRKIGQDDDDDEEHGEEGIVGRFSYCADAAIAAGSTCLMASCGFNRQRSAAKELLRIVKPLLPDGTALQMVKVSCRGLAVVRVEPPEGADSPPVAVTDAVSQVLQQIQDGKLSHTRFCERIVPAETTCLLTAAALEAALTRVVQSYLTRQQQQQHNSGPGAADEQQPLEFAVLYKSRGVDKQILAEMEKEAAKQEQQVQAQAQEEPDGGSPCPAAAAAAAAASAGDASSTGLDRQRIIDMAAAVMDACCKDTGGAKVNLNKPQVVLMVEVIPLLKQQMACAVALLPSSIMSSSKKLKVKATQSAADGDIKEARKGLQGRKNKSGSKA